MLKNYELKSESLGKWVVAELSENRNYNKKCIVVKYSKN